ncbi:MAG: hypothetical protein R3C17_13000 [Planctomycetaceae bacterium]
MSSIKRLRKSALETVSDCAALSMTLLTRLLARTTVEVTHTDADSLELVARIGPTRRLQAGQEGQSAKLGASRSGENMLDLFGGSGSTLMAEEQTGQDAFLMELDPPHRDVIVERWQKFTGRKSERVSVAQEVTA